MIKRCKVVMLPTNTKSKIWLNDNNTLDVYNHKQRLGSPGIPQHLYILSYEEIKEGNCWAINKNNDTLYFLDSMGVYDSWLKVIASTDSSLILPLTKDNHISITSRLMPLPSQSFIEEYASEYNKENKIKKVLVEYEEYTGYPPVSFMPDTLKVNHKDNTITVKKIEGCYKSGAVKRLLQELAAQCLLPNGTIHDLSSANKWIETNL